MIKNIYFFYEQRFLDTYSNLYNLSPTARTVLGIKRSKDFCRKISESQIGRIPWNKGLTKETDLRVKINSDKLKGKVKSKSLREKIRKTLIGYKHTKKAKLNMGIAQREKAWGPKSSLRRTQAKLRGKKKKQKLILKKAMREFWLSINNRKRASLIAQKRTRDKKGKFINGGVYVK